MSYIEKNTEINHTTILIISTTLVVPVSPLCSVRASGACLQPRSLLNPQCLPPRPECGRRPVYLLNKRVNRGKLVCSAPEFPHRLMMTNSSTEECF